MIRNKLSFHPFDLVIELFILLWIPEILHSLIYNNVT